jgi:Tol biopolymer transport system component
VPDLPLELDRIIGKSLEKDRAMRSQSAADLLTDLQRLKRDLDDQPARIEQSSAGSASPGRAHSSAPPAFGSSDAQLVVDLAKRHRRELAIAASLAALVLAGGFYLMRHRADEVPTPPTPASNESYRVTQLTASDNAEQPSISPDGRYLTYVQHNGDEYSLWIRQTSVANRVQIVPPQPRASLLGATFVPDGSFIDFVRRPQGANPGLWRVPLLGGPAKLLIGDVNSPVGWSPDGTQMAFVRVELAHRPILTTLIIADADGSRERILNSRRLPKYFLSLANSGAPGIRPAWSPDGKLIALAGADQSSGVDIEEIVFVDIASGSERAIRVTGQANEVGTTGLVWFNNQFLLVSRRAAPGSPGQLWWIEYPSGHPTRVTNDLSSYDGVSATADRTALATAKTEQGIDIWIGDAAGGGVQQVVPTIKTGTTSRPRVTWAGERLLYTTSAAGQLAIAVMAPPRGASEEILAHADAPAATSDGRTLLFVSTETGARTGLWKADADGQHAVQLVAGVALWPTVTPDNQQVVFVTLQGGVQSPWIVPIDGGRPQRVTDAFATAADVSPDGASILFASLDERNQRNVIICSLPACASRRVLSMSVGTPKWVPDGRSIAYVTEGNIWAQPLNGSGRRQLTHFADGRAIQDFAWSRDGKRLAIIRETASSDIVLFTGLTP